MKQTRKISISDKVFTIEDIKRLAAILENQSQLAKRSDHRMFVEFAVIFSDDTTFQSDSPDLFLSESIVRPARPVEIKMSFHNFTLERSISLSFSHGDSSYSNSAVVSANEPNWVSQNFLAITEAIQTVRPQTVWVRKLGLILINLIALGIGSLASLAIGLLVDVLFRLGIIGSFPTSILSKQTASELAPYFPIFDWFMC